MIEEQKETRWTVDALVVTELQERLIARAYAVRIAGLSPTAASRALRGEPVAELKRYLSSPTCGRFISFWKEVESIVGGDYSHERRLNFADKALPTSYVTFLAASRSESCAGILRQEHL